MRNGSSEIPDALRVRGGLTEDEALSKLKRMKLRLRQPKRLARKSTSLAPTLRNTTRKLRLRQKPSKRTKMPGETVP